MDDQEYDLAAPAAPSRTVRLDNDHPGSGTEPLSEPDGASLACVRRTVYSAGRELARGALGSVSVVQDRRLGRQVAIKEMLRPHEPGSERFLREAMITARLQHPAIVPVYEAGFWPDGTPFYAMKLVEGQTLRELIDQAGSMDERLALLPRVTTVVEAIAYAHSQRVIHRDIKPANIILGEFGETVVVDWGLAKVLDHGQDDGRHDDPDVDLASAPGPGAAADFMTRVGTIVGTPAYMAPEQSRSADVDERADIYSLGVVLYQLISGTTPYTGDSADDILDKLRAEAPVALTERDTEAPADLVAIVDRAMARKPADRYPSAAELAADLHRFLAGQRVAVHEYSAWALLGRWARRYRVALTVAAILLALLLATTVVGVWQVLEERDVARENLSLASSRRDQLIVGQARLEPDPTAAIAWLKQLAATADYWAEARNIALSARNKGIASHVWRPHQSPIRDVVLSPDGRFLASGSEDRSVRVRDLETGRTRVVARHPAWIRDVELSPTAPLVASVDLSGTLQVSSVDGATVQTLAAAGGYAADVQFAADGSYLVEIGDGDVRDQVRRAIRIHPLESGQSRTLGAHQSGLTTIALATDGRVLASGDRDGTVRLWHMPDGLPGTILRAGDEPVRALSWSADDRFLATLAGRATVRIFDAGTGLERYRGPADDPITGMAFGPRHAVLATISGTGAVRVYDVETQVTTLLGQHDGAGRGISFSPDGTLLSSMGQDDVRIWDVTRGRERYVLYNPGGDEQPLIFGPESDPVYTVSSVDGIRSWSLEDIGWRKVKTRGRGNTNALAVSPDGRYLAAGYGLGAVVLWDLDTDRVTTLGQHQDNVHRTLAFSTESTRLWSAAWDGVLMVHQLDTGSSRVVGTHGPQILAMAMAPSGRQLATGSADGTVALWNLATDERILLEAHQADVEEVAYSPDGQRLASIAGDGSACLWDLVHADERSPTCAALDVPGAGGHAVAFSPDGAYLVAGGDPWLRLYGLSPTRPPSRVRDLEGHESRLRIARFSPDSALLLSLAYGDNFALVWDPTTGASRRYDLQKPLAFAWHPTRPRLLLTTGDARLHTWDLDTDQAHPLGPLPAVADVIALADQGRAIVFGDRAQTLHIWRDDLPDDIDGLRAWLDQATTATIDADRALATPPDQALPVPEPAPDVRGVE